MEIPLYSSSFPQYSPHNMRSTYIVEIHGMRNMKRTSFPLKLDSIQCEGLLKHRSFSVTVILTFFSHIYGMQTTYTYSTVYRRYTNLHHPCTKYEYQQDIPVPTCALPKSNSFSRALTRRKLSKVALLPLSTASRAADLKRSWLFDP